MRRFVIMLTSMAVLGCCLASANAQESAPKFYAVLVGVENYQHAKLREPEPLKYPVEDVSELSEVLVARGYEVITLTDDTGKKNADLLPTRDNFMRQYKAVLRKAREQDTVIIALAGHGLQFAGQKDAYFCPIDARPFADEAETLISITSIYTELEKSFAGVKVILVDACRNDPDPTRGRGLDADSSPSPPKGVAALFSCSAGQKAFENEELKHGVFFHYLLQGLKGDAKDTDGGISFDRLQLFVREKVTQWTLDHSQKLGGRSQSPNLKADLAGKPIQLFPASWAALGGRYAPNAWRELLVTIREKIAADEKETGKPGSGSLKVFAHLTEVHFLSAPFEAETYETNSKLWKEEDKLTARDMAAFEAFMLLAPGVAIPDSNRKQIYEGLGSDSVEARELRSALATDQLNPRFWQAMVKLYHFTKMESNLPVEVAQHLRMTLCEDLASQALTRQPCEWLVSGQSLESTIADALEPALMAGDRAEFARVQALCDQMIPKSWKLKKVLEKELHGRYLRSPGVPIELMLRSCVSGDVPTIDLRFVDKPTIVQICFCGGTCSNSKDGYKQLAAAQKKYGAGALRVVVIGDGDNKTKVEEEFTSLSLQAQFLAKPTETSKNEPKYSNVGPLFVAVDEEGRITRSFCGGDRETHIAEMAESLARAAHDSKAASEGEAK